MQFLAPALRERREQNLYRQRRSLHNLPGGRCRLDGRELLNFSSNDYLGLSQHPALIEAGQRALRDFGAGSGASHLVTGHSPLHHQLEEKLAELLGRERALLFSTGYMANLGAVNALMGRSDSVFEDRLNHASLLDAGLLSKAQFQRFKHNDMADLQRLLQRSESGRKLIVADAVYSMDGDLAPAPELAEIAAHYDAILMLDDAHGFGVLGAKGAGSCEHWQLDQQQVPVLMGTLGKALGSFGAFIAGSDALIETLIQQARPYIYTTALPPAVAASTLAALELLESEAWRRDHLRQLIAVLRDATQRHGIQLMPSDTAIQPLIIGDSERALRVSEALLQRGFLVTAIRPPTVPAGSARLRITLSAAHRVADVEVLVVALSESLAS